MKRSLDKSNQSVLLLIARLQRCKDRQGGYTIVVAAAMLLILASLFLTAAIVGKVDSASTTASAKSSKGFFAAEAGLNLRAKEIRDTFEGYNRPTGTAPSDTDGDGELWDSCTTGSSMGSDDFACNNTLALQGQNVTTYVEDLTGATPEQITIPANEVPFGGLSAQEYRYDVVSVARDSQDLPTAILGMRFKSRLVPMFQFLAFFNKDFELAYPPTINLNGPIHANGDLYLNAGGSSNLTIDGKISNTGILYRGLKFQNSCGGTVRVFNPTTATSVTCTGGRANFTANNNAANWNGEINIGVDPLTVPPPEEFDPTPGQPYWDNADLRIVVDVSGASPVIQVRDSDDNNDSAKTDDLLNICPTNNTTLLLAATSAGRDLYVNPLTASGFQRGDVIRVGNDDDTNVIESVGPINILGLSTIRLRLKYPLGSNQAIGANVRESIVSTSDTFFNNREKRGGTGIAIRMLDVDMQGLLNCAQAENLMGKALDDDTEGGLVWYLTVKGANSNTLNNYGVRAYNGTELASTISGAPDINGLTIVTDNAFYVQGDYNTTNKKPAAFLADTINVLSNNWSILDDDDSLNTVTGGSRTATETTVNAAFLAGSDTTGGVEGAAGQDGGFNASYGGGFENYPRFHENWSGVAFNYRGSFVTLNQPRKANGAWCGTGNTCNIYVPPLRNWDFDQDFADAANLPPMTPQAVFLKQELFQRSFDRASVEQPIQFASNLQPRFIF